MDRSGEDRKVAMDFLIVVDFLIFLSRKDFCVDERDADSRWIDRERLGRTRWTS
jgi:hypothetical protein